MFLDDYNIPASLSGVLLICYISVTQTFSKLRMFSKLLIYMAGVTGIELATHGFGVEICNKYYLGKNNLSY